MQPYNVNVVKDDYFEFATAAGVRYICYFLSYEEYFRKSKEIANNIFGFNVEVLNNEPAANSFDERIGRTVIGIIQQFLSGLEDAVVYVCDSSDGKELLRKRKFDQWFHKYDDGTIIKVNGHIIADGFELYNAILIHKDNPRKNKFIEAFEELNEGK